MTFDPTKATQRLEAGKSIEYWFTQIEWVRRQRTKMIRAFAGTSYGKALGFGKMNQSSMVPLMQMTGQAYSTILAYHCPQFRLKAKAPEKRAFAMRWQTSLNKRVKSLQFEETLRSCAIDAFFLMAIMKTYRGQDPVGRVSMDDFVFDAGLADVRRSPFFADRYRVPLEWCRNNPAMDQSIVKKWKPVKRSERNQNSDEAWHLTSGGDSDEGEFSEMIELSDVYFADSQHVGTWRVEGNFELQMDERPAQWVKWKPAPFGPFRLCRFISAPDNAIPISPGSGVADMYAFVNALLRKVAFRAINQKDVIAFLMGDDADARKLRDASEVGMISMKDPNNVQVKKMLGVDQPLWSLFLSMLQIAKQSGGNLDAMLGLNQSADTLGQSEQIMAQVGRREAEYRSRWTQFVSEVGEDIADDMIDNPDLSIDARRPLGSTEYTVDASWRPPDQMPREMAIQDADISVLPYSMEYQTPQQIMERRMGNLGALAPYMPIGMQQGTTLNFKRVVESIADLSDDPEFNNFFDHNGLPLEQAGEEGQANLEPNTPKEYLHKNQTVGNGGGGNMLQQLSMQMGQQPAGAA